MCRLRLDIDPTQKCQIDVQLRFSRGSLVSGTKHPMKYGHSVVVLCIVVVVLSVTSRFIIIKSLTHNSQGCFTGTGTIIRSQYR